MASKKRTTVNAQSFYTNALQAVANMRPEANDQGTRPARQHLPVGAGEEAVAAFITDLIHENQQQQDILTHALETLESVLDDGLNFTTEQSADRAITAIKQALAN